jgi:hypothetical protein
MQPQETAPTAFRFVWRRLKKSHWHAVSIATSKAKTVEAAIEELRKHFEKKLKVSLTDVVVDHYFYTVTPMEGSEPAMFRSDPLTLRDHVHPFNFEYNNRVHAPGTRVGF